MTVEETIKSLETIIESLRKENQKAVCTNYDTGESLVYDSLQYTDNLQFYISKK